MIVPTLNKVNPDPIILEPSHCSLYPNAWEAKRKSYEPPMPIGYGKSPEEALRELLEWEETIRLGGGSYLSQSPVGNDPTQYGKE